MKKKEEEGLVVASLVSLVIARHRQSLLSTTTTSNSAQHVQESSLSSSSSSFWSKFKERMGRQEQAEEAGEGEFDVVAAFDAWSTQTLLQLSTHLGLKQEEFEMISLDLPKSSGISAEIQALKLVETGNGPSNFPGIVMILLLATTLSSAQSSSLLARYDSRLRSVLREVGRLLHVSSVSPALSLEASEAIAADCLSETANNYKNTSGDVVSTNSNPSQDQNQEQQQESSDRDKADRFKRIATIGIVSAAATITLAVSGGLAAPLIGTGLVSILSGMGVAGGAAAAAGLASAAGIGIVTTLFGVAGGGITAWKMKTRFSDVKEFSFHQILMAKRMVDESLRPPLPPRVSSRPYDITTTSVPPLNATPSNAADTTTSVSSSPIHPPRTSSSVVSTDSDIPSHLQTLQPPPPPPHVFPSIHLLICVSGWIEDELMDDTWLPWLTALSSLQSSSSSSATESVALIYDPDHLMTLGKALNEFVSSTAVTVAATTILKTTLFSTLMIALAWPIGLLQLSYIVDNPWSVALNRAERAGILLARECLAKAIQGGRPVSLCGYGMGARVVYYCCVELWELGCFGLIDSVFLAGAPVVVEISSYSTTNNILNPEKENDKNIIGSGGSSKAEGDGKNQPTASPLSSGWTKMRQVCAGRVVNGYSKNDWLLRFLFRGLVGGQMLAGLGPVCDDNLAIENIDLSDLVAGHLKYKEALPEILKQFKVQD